MLQANLSDINPQSLAGANRTEVRASQVADLVDDIVDPSRQRPLLVITPAGTRNGPRIDASRLPPEARHVVDVRILTSTAAVLRLSELLPKPLRVYGGAGRIYWPRLSLAHGPQQHPVILAFSETDPQEPLTRIAAELAARQPQMDPEPEGARRLAVRGLKLRRLHRDLTSTREVADQAVRRAEAAEHREHQLKTQLQHLQAQYAELTAEQPPLFADPLRQLRHDLHLTWLRTVPEPDRDHAPLRAFTVGPDLIDSALHTLATVGPGTASGWLVGRFTRTGSSLNRPCRRRRQAAGRPRPARPSKSETYVYPTRPRHVPWPGQPSR